MVEAIGFTREIVTRLDTRELIPDEFESYQGDHEYIVYQASPYRHQIENTFNDGSGEKTQITTVITREVKIKSFRMFVNLFSFAECPIVPHSIEDSDFTYLQKVNQHDQNFPGCEVRVLIYRNDVVQTFATTKVLNKRPGYYINLLRFLTDREYLHMQIDTQLRIVVKDLGFGLPNMNDTLTTFAEIEEVGHLVPMQQQSSGSLTFPDTLNVNLTGTTNNSGSNGGETLTPKIKLVYTGVNTINQLLLTHVFALNEYITVDLAQYDKQYYALQKDVVIELTDLLQLGSGFIILALQSVIPGGGFVSMVDPWSVDIEPFGSAYLQHLQVTDSSTGMEGWYWCWALKIIDTNTSIEIGFEERKI